jgi:hypothetical protein
MTVNRRIPGAQAVARRLLGEGDQQPESLTMSFGAVQSDPRFQSHHAKPPPSFGSNGSVQGDFGSPPSARSSGGGATAGSGNPFAAIVSDIQAILVQAQSGASQATGSMTSGGATSGATTTSSTPSAATTPEQDLVNQIQSLIAGTRGGSAGAGTASVTPDGGSGLAGAHHHHHHHHHEFGTDGTGGAPASSATASAQDAGSASSSDPSIAQTIAGDLIRALRSYGATPTPPATASSPVTA